MTDLEKGCSTSLRTSRLEKQNFSCRYARTSQCAGPIRFILTDVLRDAGYLVVEARDGEEGLAILLSGQAIDLIVTDVRMPGAIDGMELARRSKVLDPARCVIVCSGHLLADESDPADAFMAKPYATAALLEIVERLMEKSVQPRTI